MRKFGKSYYMSVNLILFVLVAYILVVFPLLDFIERKPASFLL